MTYFYLGHARLSWIFDTPNHCATINAMMALILVGIALELHERGREIGAMIVTAVAMIPTFLLLLTYSRGGWVAFLSGLFALAFFSEKLRSRYIIVPLFCFLIGLALVPEGINRTTSIAMGQDDSILHRLEVWKGAAEMAASNAMRGVGPGNFGETYSQWYQSLSSDQRYTTALNNYLTIASERGLPALSLFIFLLMAPMWMAIRKARRSENQVILGFNACLVCYAISGCFTCSLPIWYINALAGSIWLGVLIYGVLDLPEDLFVEGVGKLLKSIAAPIFIAILISASIGISGLILSRSMDYSIEDRPFVSADNADHEWKVIRPRAKSSRGLIIYLPGDGEEEISGVRNLVRPLAGLGFSVVVLDARKIGRSELSSSLRSIQAIMASLGGQERLYICGEGSGATLALLDAAALESGRLNAAISIGPELYWPMPDLSVLSQLQDLKVPLLLITRSDISPANSNLRQLASRLTDSQVEITRDEAISVPNTIAAFINRISYEK